MKPLICVLVKEVVLLMQHLGNAVSIIPILFFTSLHMHVVECSCPTGSECDVSTDMCTCQGGYTADATSGKCSKYREIRIQCIPDIILFLVYISIMCSRRLLSWDATSRKCSKYRESWIWCDLDIVHSSLIIQYIFYWLIYFVFQSRST